MADQENILDCFLKELQHQKFTEDGLKEFLRFIEDSKIKDFPLLDLADKNNLLKSVLLEIKRSELKTINRLNFQKITKNEFIILEKNTYLDLVQLDNYFHNKKEKDRLGLLRKYGLTREQKYDSPLRAEFSKQMENRNFRRAGEIILILAFRKATGISPLTKSRLLAFRTQLLAKAKRMKIPLEPLTKEFTEIIDDLVFEKPKTTEVASGQHINFVEL
jgi:hypothetical protein